MRLMLVRYITLFVLATGGASLAAQTKAPVVLAAASLQDVLTAESEAWEKQGHAKPVLAFAASSALARQIENGAPADIFISADEAWMDDVASKGGLHENTRANLVTNQLVLIAPATSTLHFRIAPHFALDRALGDGRLAMADPDAVPAGKYGKAALTVLGVWDSVANKIARAENVRAALALVARGEAPLGIVYATDARASTAVRIVAIFPEGTHPRITYPIALLKAGTSPDAPPFLAFLRSKRGQAIFRQFGFGPA